MPRWCTISILHERQSAALESLPGLRRAARREHAVAAVQSALSFVCAASRAANLQFLHLVPAFSWRGLCTYLYLRLFLPFVPALAGGIACMLSGYYILFFNMPHLSVDILVPALFLATERLLREQSLRMSCYRSQ